MMNKRQQDYKTTRQQVELSYDGRQLQSQYLSSEFKKNPS